MHILTTSSLRTRVSQAMQFVRWKKVEGDWELATVSISETLLKSVLAEPAHGLPQLDRIVNAPFFTADGDLVTSAGYHAECRTYFMPDGLEVASVHGWPSEAEVDEARDLIVEELLGDFPFASDADRTNAVALMLLPFVREMVRGATPLHNIEATVQGAGKGKLARVLVHPFLGHDPAEWTLSKSENENEKRLTTILLGSPGVVFFDNVGEGVRVGGDSLAKATAEPTYAARLLQSNKSFIARVRCAWLMTGNNPSFSKDMARRTVRIRLAPDTEHPERRTDFRHPDLEDWAAENRGRLAWAALTLVQSWLAEGGIGGGQTFGSYEGWASVLGGILDSTEVYGFLDNRDEFMEEAVEEEDDWAEAIELWADFYGTKPVKPSELHTLLRLTHELDLGLDSMDVRALGAALRSRRGRVLGGYRIERAESVLSGAESRSRATRNAWCLVPEKPAARRRKGRAGG
ncbi:hypothetical protein PP1_007095 [Pseudonocardia sp. P1]